MRDAAVFQHVHGVAMSINTIFQVALSRTHINFVLFPMSNSEGLFLLIFRL